MSQRSVITRSEWIFRVWIAVIILLWICGLAAPFVFLEPAGFWQKLMFVMVEFIWAILTAMAGFIVLIGVNKSLED